MNFWNWYTSTIKRTVLTKEKTEEDLLYYKDTLFYYLIVYSLIFSPLAILPGILASFLNDKFEILILDIAVLIVLLLLAFKRSIKIEVRKAFFISLLLIAAWTLMFSLGLEGPGEIYLFAITILTCLIKSIRDAYNIVIANALVLIFFALNIQFDWFHIELSQGYGLSEWLGITVNVIFLSIIVIVCFRIIFQKLEEIIKKQRLLNKKVKSDNIKLQQTKHDLKQRNEELDKFSHTVAHDLKEPLRSMQAFASLTLTKYNDSMADEAKKYISHIQTASSRSASLLDALLEYSQVGQDKQSSTFSVNDLVEELKNDLNQLIKENRATISYDLQLPQITGFEIEFKQLLQNLISNSIKFTKDDVKPEIKIAAEEKEKFWEFSVTDNGIGIDSHNQEKIFTIFHRLHKKRFSGTGLGLANCKKIVELHGGKIWVESEPGTGSTFYFTISKSLEDPS